MESIHTHYIQNYALGTQQIIVITDCIYFHPIFDDGADMENSH